MWELQNNLNANCWVKISVDYYNHTIVLNIQRDSSKPRRFYFSAKHQKLVLAIKHVRKYIVTEEFPSFIKRHETFQTLK